MNKSNHAGKTRIDIPHTIKLPTALDILAIPALAPLVILEVALSMMVAAIQCEHLDLDEIPRYFAEDSLPPKSLVLAREICDRAEALLSVLDAYWTESKSELDAIKTAADFPF